MGDRPVDRDDEAQLEELLQELRVALPGVQILLGFLLVVPFSDGFDLVQGTDRTVFFIAAVCAAASSVLMIAPSAHHRFAWPLGPNGLAFLLRSATIEARLALILLGVAVVASLYVVGTVILGTTAGALIALALGIGVAALWVVLPTLARRLDANG